MSADSSPNTETRVALFEIGPSAYGLPISDVLEVVERDRISAIPSLPADFGGVMNHQGDALPWIARTVLFPDADPSRPAQHVLVLAGTGGEHARLGLPVDRVLGLADLVLPTPTGDGLVVSRMSVRDRVVCMLDARRVLQRAADEIEERARIAA